MLVVLVLVELLDEELVDVPVDVLELLLPEVVLVEEPVVVVVVPPVCRAPPRKDVAHTGSELARERSSGQSLKTDEISLEWPSYHELSREL